MAVLRLGEKLLLSITWDRGLRGRPKSGSDRNSTCRVAGAFQW